MSENIVQNSITTALMVSDITLKLASGVVETAENADPRLKSDNIIERRTATSRNVQHLKRVMTQTWFTEALTMEQFDKINNAIIAGEDYLS
jgi:hypothetical protein